MADIVYEKGNAAYERRKAEIIAEITAAFDSVEREDGVTFREAVAQDFSREDAMKVDDTAARWQDVPDEDIKRYYSALYFFDPKAFRYYLPAILVWYLRNLDWIGPDFWSSTFETVDSVLSYNSDDSDWHLARFALLSRDQSAAIAHLLAFMGDRQQSADLVSWEKERQKLLAAGWEVEGDYGIYGYTEKPLRESNEYRDMLQSYWGQFL